MSEKMPFNNNPMDDDADERETSPQNWRSQRRIEREEWRAERREAHGAGTYGWFGGFVLIMLGGFSCSKIRACCSLSATGGRSFCSFRQRGCLQPRLTSTSATTVSGR